MRCGLHNLHCRLCSQFVVLTPPPLHITQLVRVESRERSGSDDMLMKSYIELMRRMSAHFVEVRPDRLSFLFPIVMRKSPGVDTRSSVCGYIMDNDNNNSFRHSSPGSKDWRTISILSTSDCRSLILCSFGLRCKGAQYRSDIRI